VCKVFFFHPGSLFLICFFNGSILCIHFKVYSICVLNLICVLNSTIHKVTHNFDKEHIQKFQTFGFCYHGQKHKFSLILFIPWLIWGDVWVTWIFFLALHLSFILFNLSHTCFQFHCTSEKNSFNCSMNCFQFASLKALQFMFPIFILTNVNKKLKLDIYPQPLYVDLFELYGDWFSIFFPFFSH